MKESQLVDLIWARIHKRVIDVVNNSKSSGSSNSNLNLNVSQYSEALLVTGARSLKGNLAVLDGITIDGVDLSALNTSFTSLNNSVASHLITNFKTAHGSIVHTHINDSEGGKISHSSLNNLNNDDHTLYAHSESGTRPAHVANRLNKNVLAGNGLLDGGNTLLNADVELYVDKDYNFDWYGEHIFFNTLYSTVIKPISPIAYDIGASNLMYRDLWASNIQATIFAETTISLIGGYLRLAKDQGTFQETITNTATQINFYKTMTINDIVEIRANAKYEILKITSLSSGTTYNVSRAINGATIPTWEAGVVYSVLGQTGNGFIDLNSTSTPKISLYKQGNSWNDQKEIIRIGDLNNNWGYSTETYGIAIGSYESGKSNIIVDQNGILKIRNHNINVVTMGSDGKFTLVGEMVVENTISSSSGIVKLTNDGVDIQTGFNIELLKGINFYAGSTLLANIAMYRTSYLSTSQWQSTLYIKHEDNHPQISISTDVNISGGLGFIDITNTGYLGTIQQSIQLSTELARLMISSTHDLLLNSSTLTILADKVYYYDMPLTSGVDNYHYYIQSFRCWFVYKLGVYYQLNVPSFNGSYPTSPVANLRVYRTDLNAEMAYINSSWQRIAGTQLAIMYETSTAQSIPNAAYTIVNFNTLNFATHTGLITIGASWRFTAAEEGTYRVSSMVTFNPTATWADNEQAALAIYKNGADFARLDFKDNMPSTASYMSLNGTLTLKLAANDYIDIRVYQATGTALSLLNDANFNIVNIERI